MTFENTSWNGTDHDRTAPNMASPRWSYSSVLTLIITVSGILTNSTILAVFFKNRSTLITPFTIYLINLLLSNLSNLIFFYPLDIFQQIYGTYWWLGNSLCTLYLYGFCVLNATMANCHLLIILSRVWAVTFPISFRARHRCPLAVKLCIGMWIFLHVCLLPGVFLDALYYRLSEETNGCQLNVSALYNWGVTIQILNYDAPLVLIALNYGFVAYQTGKRNYSSNTNRNPGHGQVHPAANGISQSTKQQGRDGEIVPRRKSNRICGQRFLVLTVLTMCVLICHTPQQAYVTWWFYTQIEIPSLLQPFNLLLAIPSVMDPILFAVTLTDVRKALLKFLHCS